ncbi:hypothetical protein HDU92_005603 [Lobulomyces angularis]|nr:hypothetical protein HDU92_005603 [Lobulomyces angularis]
MVLLDKLLARLKSDGNRVLIFSQFVMMLDILSDYMVLKGYTFQRLDGSTPGDQRKRSMEHFNQPDSTDFCFLLSTKAGGLGLNLETADTVIIFDSDWNPQNDLQAMARAHRIGQKKTVNIYRFVSKDTIEEEIIERAKRKMVIEYCIIKQMDTSGQSLLYKNKKSSNNNSLSREELELVLKFGAQNLFKNDTEEIKQETDGESKNVKTDNSKLEELNLDDILARAEHHVESAEAAGGASDGGAAFVEQWRVADIGVGSLSWGEIIPEEEQGKMTLSEEERQMEELYGARRRTAALNYSNEGRLTELTKRKKRAPAIKKKKNASKSDVNSSSPLDEKELRALHFSISKFGDPALRFDKIVEDAELEGRDKTLLMHECQKMLTVSYEAISKAYPQILADKRKPSDQLTEKQIRLIEKFVSNLPQKSKVVYANIGELENFNAGKLISHVAELRALTNRFNEDSTEKEFKSFRINSNVKKITNWKCPWSNKDDSMLLVGVFKHGFGSNNANWEKIRDDEMLCFKDKFFLGKGTEGDDAEEEKSSKAAIPGVLHLYRRTHTLLKALQQDDEKKGRYPKLQKFFKVEKRKNDDITSGTELDLNKSKKVKVVESSRATENGVASQMNSSNDNENKIKVKSKASPKTTKEEISVEFSDTDEEDYLFKVLMKPVLENLQKLKIKTSDPTQNLKENLFKIGDLIDKLLKENKKDSGLTATELERALWKYVATFWPKTLDSWEPLKKLYVKYNKKHSSATDVESRRKSQSGSRSRSRSYSRSRSRSGSEDRHKGGNYRDDSRDRNRNNRKDDKKKNNTRGGVDYKAQDGDWTCTSCKNVNFARRDKCNKCRRPRPKSRERGSSREKNRTRDDSRHRSSKRYQKDDEHSRLSRRNSRSFSRERHNKQRERSRTRKRSKSRSPVAGRRRSRSRERKSSRERRSRSKEERSRSREKIVDSRDRKSRSKERRPRSRERSINNKDRKSRSKERWPRSREKRFKSGERRSKSREVSKSRKRRSQSKEERSRYRSRSRERPSKHRERRSSMSAV